MEPGLFRNWLAFIGFFTAVLAFDALIVVLFLRAV